MSNYESRRWRTAGVFMLRLGVMLRCEDGRTVPLQGWWEDTARRRFFGGGRVPRVSITAYLILSRKRLRKPPRICVEIRMLVSYGTLASSSTFAVVLRRIRDVTRTYSSHHTAVSVPPQRCALGGSPSSLPQNRHQCLEAAARSCAARASRDE